MMKRKILVIFSVLIVIILICIGMYSQGLFNIEKRVQSPDGKTITTVYNCDVTEFPFNADAFTVRDKGYFNGTTTYTNAKFNDLWWSPNSKYMLILIEDFKEGDYYVLGDYVNNCEVNLSSFLDDVLYDEKSLKEFIRYDENERFIVDYYFKNWIEFSGEMFFEFSFIGNDNLEHKGSFKYNHANNTKSDFKMDS